MIDLWMVVSHGLWIAGLAVLLTAFSYRSWVGSQAIVASIREDMARQTARFYRVGAVLFLLGMVATAGAWWERLAWGGVLLLVLFQSRREAATEADHTRTAQAESDDDAVTRRGTERLAAGEKER